MDDPPGTVILDYRRPDPSTSWLARPLSPELSLVIWIAGSAAFAALDRPANGWLHFAIGVLGYAIVRVGRWRAAWIWKAQVALALVVTGLGAYAFFEPWSHWGYDLDYWLVYNQTFAWNYDASLRVAWIPMAGIGWLILAVVGAKIERRLRNPTQPPPCPPSAESE